MSDRRIDITGLQVLASVLATVTGAVAASYLGVAGTIIGAAVMSVASTAGSAFYKHYLGRTAGRLKELKEAAPMAAHRAAERMAGTGTHSASQRHRHPGDAHTRSRDDHARAGEDERMAAAGTRGALQHDGHARASEDELPTVVLPVTQLPFYGQDPGHEATASSGETPANSPEASVTPGGAATAAGTSLEAGAAFGEAATDDYASGGDGRGEEPPRRAGWWAPLSGWLRRRPGWLLGAVATVGLFAAVVGGITVFELAAGKPLDAVVWHRSGSGTTVGGIVGSQPSHSAPQTHTAKRSGKASSSPSPGQTSTGSPSPSPTSSSGSPSPSSGSPSPTPSSSSPSPTPATSSTSAHPRSS